jgi:hypothetical protein
MSGQCEDRRKGALLIGSVNSAAGGCSIIVSLSSAAVIFMKKNA